MQPAELEFAYSKQPGLEYQDDHHQNAQRYPFHREANDRRQNRTVQQAIHRQMVTGFRKKLWRKSIKS